MKILVELNGFNEENSEFFVQMLPYVSVNIEHIGKENNRVEITASEEHKEEIEEKCERLKKMIVSGRLGGKEIPIKTLDNYSDRVTLNNDSIFDKLIESGSVKKMCNGVYAYSGIFLSIFRYFDRKIDEFGFSEYEGIEEYEFPVLYPIDKYKKGRYFENFPHYIMFQTVMKNDINVLDRFAEKGTSDPSIFEEMKKPQNVLRNAACVPVYDMLSGAVVKNDKPSVFLVKGRCFRNEADNIFELARLNEFTMKEYVFVGTPDQCYEYVSRAKKLWQFWIDNLGINCKIDTANDSFFASNYRKLKLFQILGDSKQEFKWFLPDSEKYIACASANFHRTHFTKPYDIRNEEGSYCNSACFAFGIERLAYAFLCQNGLEPEKWNADVLKEINKYVKL